MKEPYFTLYPDVPRHIRIDEWTMNRVWYVGDKPRPALRGWTEEQLAVLREHRGKVSYAGIGKMLGKSKTAVRWASIAAFDDECTRRVGDWRNRWTDEQIEYIKANYIECRLLTVKGIAAKMGVSHGVMQGAIRNIRGRDRSGG